jgi:DNA repair protein RecO (recombination protein O)
VSTGDRARFESEGWVLHAYPYKESSLLLDVFTRSTGRVTLIARSARKPRSEMRGLLMSFQKLSLSWIGRGEIKTLAKAEWLGGGGFLSGEALLCGFYINELMMRLLAREDPHEALFEMYGDALGQLGQRGHEQGALRRFEKGMLRELGYELRLDTDVVYGAKIQSEGWYLYDPERGAIPVPGNTHENAISGQTLINIARDEFDDLRTLQESKMLMRRLVDYHLDSRQLQSRRVFKELLEL